MSKTYFSALVKSNREATQICKKLYSFYPKDKISPDLEKWLHYELKMGLNCKGFGQFVSLVYDEGYIYWGIPKGNTGQCEQGIEIISVELFLKRTITNFIEL